MEESIPIKAAPSIALPMADRLSSSVARVANFSGLTAAYLAAGSLFAAGLVILSNAAWFPHPWHQALAATLVILLGITVLGGTLAGLGNTRHLALPFYGICAILCMALPLARYIPFVYTLAYQQDLESLFPQLWPFSLSVPLFAALLGELLLANREKTSASFLVAISLVPSSMLMVFGYVVVAIMSSSSFILLPVRTFFALTACMGIGCLIVLASVMATRGMVWVGASILLATGILLEIGSAYFYGGIPVYWTTNRIWDPYPIWVPFLAGTLPGALTALLGVSALLSFAFSGRQARAQMSDAR